MKKSSLLLLIAASVVGSTSIHASDASEVLFFDKPAQKWESGGLPIGNGSLGAVLFGGVDKAVMQFNVDSLWTGNENPGGKYDHVGMGDYQNFGNLVFTQAGQPATESYRRQLDIGKAVHTTKWRRGGVTYTREAIASHPDSLMTSPAWSPASCISRAPTGRTSGRVPPPTPSTSSASCPTGCNTTLQRG